MLFQRTLQKYPRLLTTLSHLLISQDCCLCSISGICVYVLVLRHKCGLRVRLGSSLGSRYKHDCTSNMPQYTWSTLLLRAGALFISGGPFLADSQQRRFSIHRSPNSIATLDASLKVRVRQRPRVNHAEGPDFTASPVSTCLCPLSSHPSYQATGPAHSPMTGACTRAFSYALSPAPRP